MNKTTKELILGEILILLEFLCWWMLKLVFYGNNYFISHWLLVVGIFILFGIVSCLAMLLVKNKKILLAHSLFYALGIIVSFLLLNSLLVLLKTFGENLGWGFQLQSPAFLGFLILLFFSLSFL